MQNARFIKFLLFIKEIENLSKIIYFLHCIFSIISIFSVPVLVKLRYQEIINYCLVDFLRDKMRKLNKTKDIDRGQFE